MYTPENRVWWTVPKLQEPGKDSAVVAADWLAQVAVVMADLSPGSKDWWERLELRTIARRSREHRPSQYGGHAVGGAW